MFSNSVSKIFVTLLVLAVACVTASFVTRSANIPNANRSYDNIEQIRAARSLVPSLAHTLREVQLGERYGEMPQPFSVEKLLREYWLGERYGQSPNLAISSSYDQIETLRIGRGVSFTAASSYDLIEQLRLGRANKADHSYDTIEALRLGR